VEDPIFGVIDIGSNTVHLLVARAEGSRVVPLVDASADLYLGREVLGGGSISQSKLHATLLKLQEYQATATEAGVTHLHLIATEAIRAARNRDAVCAAITQATGLPVQVLSPQHEAALAFVGADAVAPSPGRHVVVDIGGGSVQVGVGAGADLESSVSLPLGAAHLIAGFLPGDPPSPAEEAALAAHLAEVLPPALPGRDVAVGPAIAVGGMARRIPQLVGEPLGVPFPAARLDDGLAAVRGQPAAVLAGRYGLEPGRARLLLPGMVLLRAVLTNYQAPILVVAAYGIREGAVLRLARHGAI
jgi:exopolyphosphatase/guanosine-5'-triphosphate,3'-diphosphate pyrophosphatase